MSGSAGTASSVHLLYWVLASLYTPERMGRVVVAALTDVAIMLLSGSATTHHVAKYPASLMAALTAWRAASASELGRGLVAAKELLPARA